MNHPLCQSCFRVETTGLVLFLVRLRVLPPWKCSIRLPIVASIIKTFDYCCLVTLVLVAYLLFLVTTTDQ